MRQPFNVKQVMKLLTDSMIQYKSKWAAAGMALILGAGSIGISFLYQPAEKAAVPEPEVKETTEAADRGRNRKRLDSDTGRIKPCSLFSGG